MSSVVHLADTAGAENSDDIVRAEPVTASKGQTVVDHTGGAGVRPGLLSIDAVGFRNPEAGSTGKTLRRIGKHLAN